MAMLVPGEDAAEGTDDEAWSLPKRSKHGGNGSTSTSSSGSTSPTSTASSSRAEDDDAGSAAADSRTGTPSQEEQEGCTGDSDGEARSEDVGHDASGGDEGSEHQHSPHGQHGSDSHDETEDDVGDVGDEHTDSEGAMDDDIENELDDMQDDKTELYGRAAAMVNGEVGIGATASAFHAAKPRKPVADIAGRSASDEDEDDGNGEHAGDVVVLSRAAATSMQASLRALPETVRERVPAGAVGHGAVPQDAHDRTAMLKQAASAAGRATATSKRGPSTATADEGAPPAKLATLPSSISTAVTAKPSRRSRTRTVRVSTQQLWGKLSPLSGGTGS